MKRIGLAYLLTTLVSIGAFADAAAAGEPSAEAKDAQTNAESLAERAFAAYGAGDYATALSLYKEAAIADPAAAIYFNIASIYDRKIPDPELAVEFYRKCVSAPDASPELTLKATARIQALSEESERKQAERARAEAQKGDAAKQTTTAPAPAAPPPPEPSNSLKWTSVVVGLAGVASIGVGIGYAAQAQSKLDSARAVCEGPLCATQAGVDDMRAASTAATMATTLISLGGAAVGVGTLMYVLASAKPAARRDAPARLEITPVLGATQAGLSISGVFF